LLWRAALPAPEYVRAAHPAWGWPQLLGYYVRRTVGYLMRRVITNYQ
jgi:hypothetical protein